MRRRLLSYLNTVGGILKCFYLTNYKPNPDFQQINHESRPQINIKINFFPGLEPRNPRALQIRAQTEYEKCAFERALVLAHRGQRMRRFPPDFAECARCAEETVIPSRISVKGLFKLRNVSGTGSNNSRAHIFVVLQFCVYLKALQMGTLFTCFCWPVKLYF